MERNFLLREGSTNVSRLLDTENDFGTGLEYIELISDSADATKFTLPGYITNQATSEKEFVSLHIDNQPLRPGNGFTLSDNAAKVTVPTNSDTVAVLWGWFARAKNTNSSLPFGVQNITNGLSAYRTARQTKTGLGQGGIDVVFDGDSMLEGYTATNLTYGSAVHFVKIALQKKFNPTSVPGGYGFLPFTEGSFYLAGPIGTANGYYDPWIFGKIGNWNNQGGSNYSTGFSASGKLMVPLQDSDDYMVLHLDGSLPADKKMQATSVQFVGGTFANHGNTVWDVKEGAVPDRGQGTKTGFHKHGTGDFATTFGAQRFGEALEPGYDKFITLAPGADNYLRISGGRGSSNPGGGNDTTVDGFGAFDGAIIYNGDENCGVRVHTNSYFGRHLNQQTFYLTDQQKGNANPFSVWGGGNYGANKAALHIIDFIINDCNDNGFGEPNVSLADYEAHYRQVIEHKLSTGASVLIYCPMKPDIPFIKNQTTVGKRWIDYVEKQKALALEYNCGYYSVWDKFGRGEYRGGLV